jgi:hypothetical protein
MLQAIDKMGGEVFTRYELLNISMRTVQKPTSTIYPWLCGLQVSLNKDTGHNKHDKYACLYILTGRVMVGVP